MKFVSFIFLEYSFSSLVFAPLPIGMDITLTDSLQEHKHFSTDSEPV